MKRKRGPTSEEFEKLLGWIDPDREAAGHKFQLILSRITRSFISRGCIDAETLTDEVSNRVAVRIDKVRQTYPDPLHCLLGFIDNVHLEYIREQRERPTLRRRHLLDLRKCLKVKTVLNGMHGNSADNGTRSLYALFCRRQAHQDPRSKSAG